MPFGINPDITAHPAPNGHRVTQTEGLWVNMAGLLLMGKCACVLRVSSVKAYRGIMAISFSK